MGGFHRRHHRGDFATGEDHLHPGLLHLFQPAHLPDVGACPLQGEESPNPAGGKGTVAVSAQCPRTGIPHGFGHLSSLCLRGEYHYFNIVLLGIYFERLKLLQRQHFCQGVVDPALGQIQVGVGTENPHSKADGLIHGGAPLHLF